MAGAKAIKNTINIGAFAIIPILGSNPGRAWGATMTADPSPLPAALVGRNHSPSTRPLVRLAHFIGDAQNSSGR
jgi:hypothetical protein